MDLGARLRLAALVIGCARATVAVAEDATPPRMPPAERAYRGRLALLVDGGCLSSREDLVMPFKDNGRAIVVGETTGGSSGQPYLLDLGDGMLALIGASASAPGRGRPLRGPTWA
ncbi:MAG TPA: S41 family peptidase [Vicinamibacteria bacterium]|nr:S41 family peptidase [Vicinamibacteria bacterium]